MKHYFSVWALLAHSSFLKITAILASMAAVEYVLLQRAMNRNMQKYEGVCDTAFLMGQASYAEGPEKLWGSSCAGLVFLAAFGMVFAVLVLTEGRQKGCRTDYTWKRLGLSPRELMAMRIFYNLSCFVILFAVQIAIGFCFLSYYRRLMPTDMVSAQLFFLSFSRSRFLHSIFPAVGAAKWLRNFLLISALSVRAAAGAPELREDRPMNSAATINLFVVNAVWFYSGVGLQVLDLMADLLCGVFIVKELAPVAGRWQPEAESE